MFGHQDLNPEKIVSSVEPPNSGGTSHEAPKNVIPTELKICRGKNPEFIIYDISQLVNLVSEARNKGELIESGNGICFIAATKQNESQNKTITQIVNLLHKNTPVLGDTQLNGKDCFKKFAKNGLYGVVISGPFYELLSAIISSSKLSFNSVSIFDPAFIKFNFGLQEKIIKELLFSSDGSPFSLFKIVETIAEKTKGKLSIKQDPKYYIKAKVENTAPIAEFIDGLLQQNNLLNEGISLISSKPKERNIVKEQAVPRKTRNGKQEMKEKEEEVQVAKDEMEIELKPTPLPNNQIANESETAIVKRKADVDESKINIEAQNLNKKLKTEESTQLVFPKYHVNSTPDLQDLSLQDLSKHTHFKYVKSSKKVSDIYIQQSGILPVGQYGVFADEAINSTKPITLGEYVGPILRELNEHTNRTYAIQTADKYNETIYICPVPGTKGGWPLHINFGQQPNVKFVHTDNGISVETIPGIPIEKGDELLANYGSLYVIKERLFIGPRSNRVNLDIENFTFTLSNNLDSKLCEKLSLKRDASYLLPEDCQKLMSGHDVKFNKHTYQLRVLLANENYQPELLSAQPQISLLMMAVFYGKKELIKEIVTFDPIEAGHQDVFKGKTALHLAMESDNKDKFEIVKILLAANCPHDILLFDDANGFTPLFSCINTKDLTTLNGVFELAKSNKKIEIQLKKSFDSFNKDNLSIVHFALSLQFEDGARFLMQQYFSLKKKPILDNKKFYAYIVSEGISEINLAIILEEVAHQNISAILVKNLLSSLQKKIEYKINLGNDKDKLNITIAGKVIEITIPEKERKIIQEGFAFRTGTNLLFKQDKMEAESHQKAANVQQNVMPAFTFTQTT